MPRFFVSADNISDGVINITGDDAHHITRVLRMVSGDNILICDMQMNEYNCSLEEFGEVVSARIIASRKIDTEPSYRVHLFQALPKGDKLDSIIQKAVECGVHDITLFESERCVVRSKSESEARRTERRQRIALEAAKQSGRGIVPEVFGTISYESMLNKARCCGSVLFCYEGYGTLPLGVVLGRIRSWNDAAGTDGTKTDVTMPRDIAVIIGPEGGFSVGEVNAARDKGAEIVGLGKRILRTETAASFVLACLVYEFDLK